MKWKMVAVIIEPQSHDSNRFLNRSFAVSELSISAVAGRAVAFINPPVSCLLPIVLTMAVPTFPRCPASAEPGVGDLLTAERSIHQDADIRIFAS
jgi:hypothetical protein